MCGFEPLRGHSVLQKEPQDADRTVSLKNRARVPSCSKAQLVCGFEARLANRCDHNRLPAWKPCALESQWSISDHRRELLLRPLAMCFCD